jgi:outer membrane protein assembly factor BamB
MYNIAKGTLLWNCTQCKLRVPVYPGSVPEMVFSPDSTTLLAVDTSGALWALDATTGASRWTFMSGTGGNLTAPLLFVGLATPPQAESESAASASSPSGLVAVLGSTSSSALTALRLTDGAVAWTCSDPGSSSLPTSIVLSRAGDVLYAAWGATVTCLGASDGTLLPWTATPPA